MHQSPGGIHQSPGGMHQFLVEYTRFWVECTCFWPGYNPNWTPCDLFGGGQTQRRPTVRIDQWTTVAFPLTIVVKRAYGVKCDFFFE